MKLKLDFEDNLGLVDRIIRTLLAIILLFLSFGKVATGLLGTVLIGISLILFVESLFSY